MLTQAEALSRAESSHSGLVLVEHADGLRECDTGGLYRGGWAFCREAFCRVRGYGPHNNGDDQELADRLGAAGVTQCDPCEFARPFCIYRQMQAFGDGRHDLPVGDRAHTRLEMRSVSGDNSRC